jgi:hypothetical protein
MAFLEEGGESLAIAWVLSGSIIIPFLDTINPSSLPFSTAKTDFLGLRDMPNLWHHSRTSLR